MSNYNFGGWDKSRVRLSSVGFKYMLMDTDSKKYKWLTKEEIKAESVKSGANYTNGYKNFMETIETLEKELDEYLNGDFEKIILKKYYFDDEMMNTDSEIIELHYPSYPGKVISMPKLVKRITGIDFNQKMDGWGIDYDILLEAKKRNVEDIDFIDEFTNIHFFTTMNKFNLNGQEASWGKVYLAIRYFTVKRYSDKIPFYNRFIKGI